MRRDVRESHGGVLGRRGRVGGGGFGRTADGFGSMAISGGVVGSAGCRQTHTDNWRRPGTLIGTRLPLGSVKRRGFVGINALAGSRSSLARCLWVALALHTAVDLQGTPASSGLAQVVAAGALHLTHGCGELNRVRGPEKLIVGFKRHQGGSVIFLQLFNCYLNLACDLVLYNCIAPTRRHEANLEGCQRHKRI